LASGERDHCFGRSGGLEAGAELLDALVVSAQAVAGPVNREHGAVVEEPVW
jgi:hypothetical protein